jgi:hypothetical protein
MTRRLFDEAAIELGQLPIEAEATTGVAVWIKITGVWKQAIPWIKIAGVWKQATPWIKISGIWKDS